MFPCFEMSILELHVEDSLVNITVLLEQSHKVFLHLSFLYHTKVCGDGLMMGWLHTAVEVWSNFSSLSSPPYEITFVGKYTVFIYDQPCNLYLNTLPWFFTSWNCFILGVNCIYLNTVPPSSPLLILLKFSCCLMWSGGHFG